MNRNWKRTTANLLVLLSLSSQSVLAGGNRNGNLNFGNGGKLNVQPSLGGGGSFAKQPQFGSAGGSQGPQVTIPAVPIKNPIKPLQPKFPGNIQPIGPIGNATPPIKLPNNPIGQNIPPILNPVKPPFIPPIGPISPPKNPIGPIKPIDPLVPIGPVKPPIGPIDPIGPIGPVKPPIGPFPPINPLPPVGPKPPVEPPHDDHHGHHHCPPNWGCWNDWVCGWFPCPIVQPCPLPVIPVVGAVVVPPVGESLGQFDLAVKEVRIVEVAGGLNGPMYRVFITNKGMMDMVVPTRVAVLGMNDQQPTDATPRAIETLKSLKSGETVAMDIRLPATAASYPGLLVVVEVPQGFKDANEQDNVAQGEVARLPVVASIR